MKITSPLGRPHPVRRLRAVAFAAIAAAALLGLAPGASAATIDVAPGNVLKVTGGEGVEDFLFTVGDEAPSGGFEINTYSTSTGFVELTDAAESFGCEFAWEGSSTIVCPAGVARISADLRGGDDDFGVLQLGAEQLTIPVGVQGGGGADEIDSGAAADRIDAGPGDDIVEGCDEVDGDGGDQLLGGDGNDELKGCDGNDLLDGGAGDDDFDFGGFSETVDGGADTYVGGPGTDSFSYFSRKVPVSVSLDNLANDGAANEGDNVGADVETLGGGWGDDVIVGSGADDYLFGSLGSDRISGAGGNDTVKGNEGIDQVDGGPGNDEVDGGCHADTLIGGADVDKLISDGGCGTGYEGSASRSPSDVLNAVDGARDELIFCQIESIWDPVGDTAIVDPSDPVTTTGPGRCGTINVVLGNDNRSDKKGKCVVPKLKNKPLKKAKTMLKGAKCSLGKVTRTRSKKVGKGRIIAHKPKSGSVKAAGAKVKVVVSAGR